MRDLWLLPEQAVEVIFQDAVRFGNAFVLAQMLQPRFDQKGFHEPAAFRSVLEDAPRIGTIAAALGSEALNCSQE